MLQWSYFDLIFLPPNFDRQNPSIRLAFLGKISASKTQKYENDELKDLGTVQGLNRVKKWFGMTDEKRQSLKGTSVPAPMDDTIEIGDIDLDNVGNNDGPPKPPETGTKPKDPILKPSQVTKQLDNLNQSASGAVQSRLADHQTTNVNGQRLANQTSLSKKTKVSQ